MKKMQRCVEDFLLTLLNFGHESTADKLKKNKISQFFDLDFMFRFVQILEFRSENGEPFVG